MQTPCIQSSHFLTRADLRTLGPASIGGALEFYDFIIYDSELQAALTAAGDASTPHLIEVMFPRMEVPEPLARFARRAAEFDFSRIREEDACNEP